MSRITTNEIFDWICILMFVLGFLGNSLGLVVFSSRKFRRTTYGRLAIASLIINLLCVCRYSLLLHSTTRRWITLKVGQSWFNCKLYRFSSCLRILSAFVTVAWTYERFSFVTTVFNVFTNHPFVKRYKFYFMGLISLLVVGALTGPTVYFHEPLPVPILFHHMGSDHNSTPIFFFRLSNMSSSSGYLERALRQEENDVTTTTTNGPPRYQMICGLKRLISPWWRGFLLDVTFAFNYTTLRSVLSEIIPSVLVIFFNIGIIVRVIQATLSFPSTSSANTRPSNLGSIHSKDGVDGLVVHNRPRTSWMNIVLIIHSCLFFFSSLTATIVHWFTSDALLSHWVSVVILANCSLNFYVYCLSGRSFRNEIRKLFRHYFQLYCALKFMNLFRNKSQREQAARTVHIHLARNRSTLIPPPTTNNPRTASFNHRYN